MSNSSIRPKDRTLSFATSPATVYLEARGTLHSPMLQYYWSLTIKLFSVITGESLGWESYLSAVKQSVYSTAPADQAKNALRSQKKDRFLGFFVLMAYQLFLG